MRVNYLFIFSTECSSEGQALLAGERAVYVREQHEVYEGLSLAVVIEGRGRGTGVVSSVQGEQVSIQFQVTSAPPAPFPSRCLIGLPRPQTVKKVLELCAALGVDELHFVASELGQKSYQSSTVFEEGELRRLMVKGAEQGGEWRLPKVVVHSHLKKCLAEICPLVQSGVHPARQTTELLLLADTEASFDSSLNKVPRAPGAAVLLAVGPEAGWSMEERQMLVTRGFLSISLGSRVLRVEQALAFVFGQVALHLARET